MFDEVIKNYLKNHLSINIKEESYGFNGKCITIELKVEGEVIDSISYSIRNDEG